MAGKGRSVNRDLDDATIERVEARYRRESEKAIAEQARRDAMTGGPIALHRKDGVEVAKYYDDGPTAERRQQGEIVRSRQKVGNEFRPVSRSVDIVAHMERTGMINHQQAQSARRFRSLFETAGFQKLKAQDLQRGGVTGGGASNDFDSRASDAAHMIGDIIEHLGGHGTPVSKAAWHVLGWEKTIRDWTDGERLPGRKLNEQVGRGLVIGAIVALDVFFYANRRE